MPKPITDVRGTDISVLLNPGTERRQPLAGFDDDYVDIVDYIVRCTHKIWEEKQIGLIYSHYLHNSLVHTGESEIYGREAMVAGTVQTIAAWPDRLLYADDVVWCGNDTDGFYSSHRYTSVGAPRGVPGATSRPVSRRSGIALCYVRENRIIEEWVVSDDIAWAQGMGLSVDEVVAGAGSAPLPTEEHGEIERTVGQQAPEPHPPQETAGFDVDYFVRRTMHEVWNRRMLGELRTTYAPNYICHTMGEQILYGRGEYTALVLNLLAAFPDGLFAVDHLYSMDDGDGRYRTSMRWSLVGTHSGHGMFGAPTGVRCRIWGITQHHIRAGQFAEEWTYTNEMAVRKRLHQARHGK